MARFGVDCLIKTRIFKFSMKKAAFCSLRGFIEYDQREIGNKRHKESSAAPLTNKSCCFQKVASENLLVTC